MGKRRAWGAALALGLAACTENGTAKRAPAPAPEVLDTLVPALVEAVADKESAFVVRHVALDFREDGGLDYYDVRSLVESFALRDEPIGAQLLALELDPPDAEGRRLARARVRFAVGGTLEPESPPPTHAVTYALEIVFARNPANGLWQAAGGRYRREAGPSTVPETPPTSSAAPG